MRILNQMLAIVNGRVVDNIQSPGGTPDNTYTQSTTINSSAQNGLVVFFVLLGIIGVVLIARWIILSEKETPSKSDETTTPPTIAEKRDADDLCAKIHRLDPADLSSRRLYRSAFIGRKIQPKAIERLLKKITHKRANIRSLIFLKIVK